MMMRGETKMVVRTKVDDMENYLRARSESKKRVEKYGVFDIKRSEYGLRLRRTVCTVWRPCPALVSVYARFGLHRYNFFMGKKFQFIRVKKYVMTTPLCAACYYITLEAMDPSSCSRKTFQTKVSEKSLGRLILTCNIARIRGKTTKIASDDHDPSKFLDLGNNLPEWPTENSFENSKVKESDNDWIRLYLELAVATTFRSSTSRPSDYDTSKLEILKVAMETRCDVNDADENVTVLYIKFKDLCESRVVGKDADRIAIIRRRFNKLTGWFSLEGRNQSSESLIPPKKGKKRPRLGVFKPWRLSNPRLCKSFKNHCVGGVLAHPLQKIRSM